MNSLKSCTSIFVLLLLFSVCVIGEIPTTISTGKPSLPTYVIPASTSPSTSTEVQSSYKPETPTTQTDVTVSSVESTEPTTVPTNTNSTATVQCPPSKKILCFGTCVRSASECAKYAPVNTTTCTGVTPFTCSDGTCKSSLLACKAAVNTSTCAVECWNGACVQSAKACPPTPSCYGTTPKRCSDGTCVAFNVECPPVQTNATCGYLCPDLSCAKDEKDCPPYDGCPLDKPILCPDEMCVTSFSECLCSNGLFKCFSGNCVVNETECERPLFFLKPADMVITLNSQEDIAFDVFSLDYSSQLSSVSIARGTFNSSRADNTVNQSVNSVAESVIRDTRHKSWADDQGCHTNLLSPVLALSVDATSSSGFSKPVNISFHIKESLIGSKNHSRLCLAYIDEVTGEWVCQDYNLTITQENKNGSIVFVVSGLTTHYTNFAVLLEGDKDSNSDGENSDNYLESSQTNSSSTSFPIIPIVAVSAAVFVVIAGIIGVIMYRRRNQRIELKDMELEDSYPASTRHSSVEV